MALCAVQLSIQFLQVLQATAPALSQLSKLDYGKNGLPLLCINKTDVEEDEETYDKWDEEVAEKRAPALNALLCLANDIGTKVILFNWAGVSMKGHLLTKLLHMEYVSVYVQNLLHPRYCVTHNRACGKGPEGQLKAKKSNTLKIFAASEALNAFHRELYGCDMRISLLECLSGPRFKYVDPRVIVKKAVSSCQSTVVIDEDLVDFGESEKDLVDHDDDDEEEYEVDDDDEEEYEDDDVGDEVQWLGVVGQPTTMFDHSNQVGAEIIATSIRLVSNSLHFSRASPAWHIQRLGDCSSRRPVKRH